VAGTARADSICDRLFHSGQRCSARGSAAALDFRSKIFLHEKISGWAFCKKSWETGYLDWI
jgi:hypothetical protein